jgi:predicted phosphodiesterase
VTVATLYDVHGNLPALDAVLREIPDDAVVVVGGDVAAGPFPQETVDRLRGLGDRVHWLRGNADRELVPGQRGLAPPEIIDWVRDRMSPDTVTWLGALPPTLVLDGVFYCHASARNDEEIFTELTPDDRVAPLFAGVGEDTIVCGHTHMQFDRFVAGKRIVNSGSVGMSYDEPHGAYWRLDLEPRCTPYALDLGEYPFDWPAVSRAEVLELFESRAV